ncbi:hypothetical protein FWG76_02555 [Candidatus Saccharibacteria bacterium]|nr:hypothetical protein [Candidatus Saccharibacteria bacterium]
MATKKTSKTTRATAKTAGRTTRAAGKRVSVIPRDKREINTMTLVLGGVFVGLYIAAWLTMLTVNAGEMRVLEERAEATNQESEMFVRALFDAEFDERAEKIIPIIDDETMTLREQAEALRALDLGFDTNKEFAEEEAERLTNLSADCDGS